MRRAVYFLLALVALTYFWQAFEVGRVYYYDCVKVRYAGKLSDIADEVTRIALETPDSGAVTNVHNIRRDGDNVFLLSDNRLLHYNLTGKLLNEIGGDGEGQPLINYALDTVNHRVIVIDSNNLISCYNYAGNLLSVRTLPCKWYRLTAMAWHNHNIYLTAEDLVAKADGSGVFEIRHKLYQIDYQNNITGICNLHHAETGREIPYSATAVSEILFDDKEEAYAYSQNADCETLLKDTLYFLHNRQLPFRNSIGGTKDGMASVYPFRRGKRYIISPQNPDNRLFCYDSKKNIAYMLSKGFKDDFCGGDFVRSLLPTDNYGNSYGFLTESGNSTDLVLFRLKG